MEKKTYDILAFIGRQLLVALATLYATLGKIWNLPYTVEIPATLSAVAFFINTLLKKDSDEFFKDKEF